MIGALTAMSAAMALPATSAPSMAPVINAPVINVFLMAGPLMRLLMRRLNVLKHTLPEGVWLCHFGNDPPKSYQATGLAVAFAQFPPHSCGHAHGHELSIYINTL